MNGVSVANEILGTGGALPLPTMQLGWGVIQGVSRGPPVTCSLTFQGSTAVIAGVTIVGTYTPIANDVVIVIVTNNAPGSPDMVVLGALNGSGGGSFPVGALVATAASTADPGFLLCDGTSYLRATYPTLFSRLGGASSPWGLPDGNHFRVPDLRGKVIVCAGQGSGLTNRVLAATGGEEGHVLTIAELAAHSHTGNTGIESANHTHSQSIARGTSGTYGLVDSTAATSSGFLPNTAGQSNDHTHPISRDGSGSAHNNMQPFAVVRYQIKF